MNARKFGLEPDPGHARGNWYRDCSAASYPEALDYSSTIDYCRDQAYTSSCYGFGMAGAIQLGKRLNSDPSFPFPSALYLYTIARDHEKKRLPDGFLPDVGTTMFAGFSSIAMAGFCSEVECPFDFSMVESGVLLHHYIASVDNRRLLGYPLSYPSESDIKSALAAKHAVLIRKVVGKSYQDHQGSDIWQGEAEPLGGHCTCLVGYGRDFYLERNSYGPGWGMNGLARIAISTVDSAWVLRF